MKSPMLKRRLNPFLLATTILVLSILASLSVLYQGQLSNILQEKNNLSEELEERDSKINNLEQENSNLSDTVNSQAERIETYQNEKDLLESQLDSINSTVQSLREQVDDLEAENAEIRDQMENLNDTMFVICTSNNTIDNGEDLCSDHGHSYEGY